METTSHYISMPGKNVIPTPPQGTIQFRDDSTVHQSLVNETRKETIFRVGAAATTALLACNLSHILNKEASYTFVLTNLGIVLGNSLAFPPQGSMTTTVAKTTFCALLMQTALFPQTYWDDDKLKQFLSVGSIYSATLAFLWSMTNNPTNSKKAILQRCLGAIVAAGMYKTSDAFLSEKWATVVGNLGIGVGSVIAFPPALNKIPSSVKTCTSIALAALIAQCIKEKDHPTGSILFSTFCGIITLASIWYDGRRNLITNNVSIN